MTTYQSHDSGYAGAMLHLKRFGGQFYPAKGRDGTSTIVRGSQVHTFWEENSLNRPKVAQAARDFGFDPTHATPGRLARWILRDICNLNCSRTDPEKRFIQLAKDGFHWHYTYIEPGRHDYLLEFDLKAAYFTSLMQEKSFFYSLKYGDMPDSGALECLRSIAPAMPKWLRLTLLGTIASHQMTFATLTTGSNGYDELKFTTIRKIDYGAAFNCVHRSILRLYRVMQRVHEMGGSYIKRMHTDSFAFQWDVPESIASQIFDYLDRQGFAYTCKAQGSAFFWNLNEGFIGRHFVGSRAAVREGISQFPQKPRLLILSKHNARFWQTKTEVPTADENTKASHTIGAQLDKFEVNKFTTSNVKLHTSN